MHRPIKHRPCWPVTVLHRRSTTEHKTAGTRDNRGPNTNKQIYTPPTELWRTTKNVTPPPLRRLAYKAVKTNNFLTLDKLCDSVTPHPHQHQGPSVENEGENNR